MLDDHGDSSEEQELVYDSDVRVVIILDNGKIITEKSASANDSSPPVIPLPNNLSMLVFGQRFRGD